MFHDLSKYLKFNIRDMVLIDDTHTIIKDVIQEYKMDAMHVSEFLTEYTKL